EIHSGFTSSINATFSDIQGGWEGEGNIDADPLFADPDKGDYHLKSEYGRWDAASGSWVVDEVTSPCIDAGDPNSAVGDEPEPNGGRINMGAYGGTAEASKSGDSDD
ncbi:MAG: PGF-pre-PGF domain-containing protein, partial [Planctomycetota bacterium]